MKITLNNVNQLKYIPKTWSTIIYFIILGLVLLLFGARKIDDIRFEFLNNYFPDYYQHISNFTISFMLVLVAGYTNVLQNRSLTRTYVTAIILISANVIYELYLPIINTMDIIDAYYGVAGSLAPFIYLIPYQKYGTVENPKYIDSTNQHNTIL